VNVLSVAAFLADTLGQFSTTTALFEQAVALDPLNLASLESLGRIYTKTGRYEEAIQTFNRMLELNPEYPNGHIALGRTYLLMGDPEQSLIETNKNSTAGSYRLRMAKIHFTLGNKAQSQAIIEELLDDFAQQYPGPMASLYAWRGENDLAFEWFEIAFKAGDSRLNNFLGNEWLRGLESDPRYPVLLEKMGL